MARLPRLAVAGLPHLVVQRGHNAQGIFIDAIDRATYRTALRDAARKAGVAIHAYGLLDGQVRLLVTPESPQALSAMMQSVGRRYTAGFNQRHGRSGTLWDGRFRATVVDAPVYLLSCMRFVEVDAPDLDAEWSAETVSSSAPHHLGRWIDPIVSDHTLYWALGNTPFDRDARFGALLREPLAPSLRDRIDAAVNKGWALGDAAFVASLHAAGTRRVVPRRPGRPRKNLSVPI